MLNIELDGAWSAWVPTDDVVSEVSCRGMQDRPKGGEFIVEHRTDGAWLAWVPTDDHPSYSFGEC